MSQRKKWPENSQFFPALLMAMYEKKLHTKDSMRPNCYKPIRVIFSGHFSRRLINLAHLTYYIDEYTRDNESKKGTLDPSPHDQMKIQSIEGLFTATILF